MNNEEALNAVYKVRLSLDEVHKWWKCPAENNLLFNNCENCNFRIVCDLTFELKIKINELYWALANALEVEHD